MRVLVVNHISLDGVMQSPGRPYEDPRAGFAHGGWAAQANDPAIGAVMGERMGQDFAWLFGRRSYDGMLGYWNEAGGPFKDGLNQPTKYVASSNPDANLPWPNSTLLSGDVPGKVAALREQPGGNLVVMGSGQLIRSLLPLDLVDELFLMLHPLVLGSGRRLFDSDGQAHYLRLVDSTATADGLLLATYQRDPAVLVAIRCAWLPRQSGLLDLRLFLAGSSSPVRDAGSVWWTIEPGGLRQTNLLAGCRCGLYGAAGVEELDLRRPGWPWARDADAAASWRVRAPGHALNGAVGAGR